MNNTYYYGIDFRKIDLYCKVKTFSAIEMKNRYREISNILLKIDTEKFYHVEIVNFDRQLVTITVDCIFTKYSDKERRIYKYEEDRITIALTFDMVDFSYYFEDTTEDELEETYF